MKKSYVQLTIMMLVSLSSFGQNSNTAMEATVKGVITEGDKNIAVVFNAKTFDTYMSETYSNDLLKVGELVNLEFVEGVEKVRMLKPGLQKQLFCYKKNIDCFQENGAPIDCNSFHLKLFKSSKRVVVVNDVKEDGDKISHSFTF